MNDKERTAKLKRLAQLRKQMEEDRALVNAYLEEIKKDPRWTGPSSRTTAATVEASQLYIELVEESVRLFRETQKKKPFPGLEVKETIVLDYNPVNALEWCKTNLPGAIKLNLNTTLFETNAKAMSKNGTPLDFVTITTEPKGQIASDLSTYLTEETHD